MYNALQFSTVLFGMKQIPLGSDIDSYWYNVRVFQCGKITRLWPPSWIPYTPWADPDPLPHLQRLEIANQVNASFTQMKTKKRRKDFYQLGEFPAPSGNLGMGPVAVKLRIRTLRKLEETLQRQQRWRFSTWAGGWSAQPHLCSWSITQDTGKQADHQGSWDILICKLRKWGLTQTMYGFRERIKPLGWHWSKATEEFYLR